MANDEAPAGQVFVCVACGKLSRDRYGYRKISPGWDESCMLNSEMFSEDKLVMSTDGGRVVQVLE